MDSIFNPWPITYSSGGGFSNIYPIPDYQKAAVDKYIQQHFPPYQYYESTANSSFGKNRGLSALVERMNPSVAI